MTRLGCQYPSDGRTQTRLWIRWPQTWPNTRQQLGHKSIISDLKKRVGAIRRLATSIGRGKLLREVAQCLVLGKVQTNAFVTKQARLQAGPMSAEDTATQRVLNDLYRVITGLKRTDHIRGRFSHSRQTAHLERGRNKAVSHQRLAVSKWGPTG